MLQKPTQIFLCANPLIFLCAKRRRGRRPQAAPAWMRQPFNLNSPIAHPEQNEATLAGLVLPDMPAFDDIMDE